MSSRKIPFRHIAVEGPIGVGKTSLVQALADRFEGVMVLEDITNPFLPSFYEGGRARRSRSRSTSSSLDFSNSVRSPR